MLNNGKIAFLDLISPHEELKSELVAVFQQALGTAGFIGGPMVDEFERSPARRYRRHGPPHVYRDHRSDHPGGRTSGFRRYR